MRSQLSGPANRRAPPRSTAPSGRLPSGFTPRAATELRDPETWRRPTIAEPTPVLDAAEAALAHAATGEVLVVAVSGGADSTALAWICAALRERGRLPTREVVLAHCDHRQHPQSAAAVAAVASLAERLGCGFAAASLDLLPGASEERMRDARYVALGAIAREHRSRVIATGHHLDDQVETVLMRWLRGSGSRGLAGIPTRRPLGEGICLVRPLLGVGRATLRALVAAAGIRWLEDPTNVGRCRTRVRIRNELLPELRTRGPIDQVLAAVATAARADATATEDAARRWIAAHARGVTPSRIELTGFGGVEPHIAREVLRLLHVSLIGNAPLGHWLDRALALGQQRTGARLDAGLNAERTRRGMVLFDPARVGHPPTGPVALVPGAGAVPFGTTAWSLRATWFDPSRYVTPRPRTSADREQAVFDADAAPPPWRIRRPGTNDIVDVPGPRSCTRSLRGLFQARGVPRLDRSTLPLLTDVRDRIVWGPGLDVAAFARVVPETRRAILVERDLPPGGIVLPERSY